MAARDIPSPFREGFKPTPNRPTINPTVVRSPYDGKYPGDPGKGMGQTEKFGRTVVEEVPYPVKNLKGR